MIRAIALVLMFAVPSMPQINALRGRGAILAPQGALTITTISPLPQGTKNTTYSQTLGVTGGTGPYTWAVTSGTICVGLSLSSVGVVSGTPMMSQNCAFTVTVTDAVPNTNVKAFTILIPGLGLFPLPVPMKQ